MQQMLEAADTNRQSIQKCGTSVVFWSMLMLQQAFTAAGTYS